ncbi:alcohol dehydrogenase-like 2 [Cajanus cajan]|uniref:alcohol dehydrogenase n=1 Tax=Cajanus cajan TaxID=3821 RepID=A0A151RDF6_CAJCA|nr:alcohol dehydrogenase-like 2 [Cajanus cajan]KYP40576.1 Alcohol dehydrogenase-like 2 [Cajanus cajan]
MASRSNIKESIGKPIRCKAAICRKAGEPLIIEEVELDPPKAWEVRIKILCTTLCHSDVSMWKMDSGPLVKFPRIFGHEAVGVVESVGEHVEEVKEGDLVVPVFLANCGECSDCKSPKSNQCTKFGNVYTDKMPRDGTSRFRDMKGEVVHHYLHVSSFSEYTVVDVTHVVKITHDLPVDKACLLSCGVSTGIGAVWKVADVEEGSTVAIFGLGTVGMAVAVAAKQRGASKIIGIDLNPEKFEIGKRFGITDFVNPSDCKEKEKSVSEVIKEMTDGGAGYCFECIGLASLMADAFNSSRDGWGKTIILGVDMHGSPLSLSPYALLRGKTVTGSFFGGIKPKIDVPFLAKTYLDKLNIDDFISHEVGLEDINKAFDYLLEGKSLRCIIRMNH